MKEATGSLQHQLALVYAIRQVFTQSAETVGPVEEALQKTHLIGMVNHILSFASVEEEIYFMKLEALWLLIDLSMCDTDATKLVCLSDLTIAESPPGLTMSTEDVARDFDRKKSELLLRLDKLLQEALSEPEGPDMKVVFMALHFYANFAASGPEYAHKLLRDTSVVHLCHHFVESKLITSFTDEMLGCVARLIGQLASHCYQRPEEGDGDLSEEDTVEGKSNRALAGVLICTAHAILETRDDADSRRWAIDALAKLAKKNTALHGPIASQRTIAIIMDCLESREPTAYKAALKCLANLMSGEGDEVARWAIQGGLLPRAAEILSQGLVKDKKTMLWTLSNIAGSPDAELRQSVLEETLLMQQVVQLMSSASSEEIRGEAAWVVTNLLTCGGAGDYQRGRFVQEMGSELIMQLVSLLKELPNQPAIQFEVLTAVARLLELDGASQAREATGHFRDHLPY